ncbi:zinc finger protein, putative [Plasmodium vivax]|uniref:RING-type E3 ubiquitin transferase n=1 Tax=Plasmodium vivax TaxID=5855 RepID=A0A1G4GW82_PLAVI|nr:unnamed protein product [Plasmodium vivax]SCO66847.1 zinc finger protein, putative [Plasmodium vivax]SCO72275.1 zinc finger protein, putative [Plasmodium vivax]VUZ95263.1 zinc finger protein, putative [Plasmodium vivax]
MSVLSLFHIGSPFLRTNCVEEKKIYENFICSVCLDICHTPVVTVCNHICCYKCLYYSLLHKRKCPICKQAIRNNELKRIAGKRKREYEQLRIRCNLCKEELKIKNYEKHLKICKYKRCKNYMLGCDYYDKRNKLKAHEETCEHRLIRCSSCYNLFYYKNRIFMLTLKEKYEMNVRCTYTYYSFYYNLLMNTNFNFFKYNKCMANKYFSCDNYLSKKLSLLRSFQRTLERFVGKSDPGQGGPTVDQSNGEITQSSGGAPIQSGNLLNNAIKSGPSVFYRGRATGASELEIEGSEANYQRLLNFAPPSGGVADDGPLHMLRTSRLANAHTGGSQQGESYESDSSGATDKLEEVSRAGEASQSSSTDHSRGSHQSSGSHRSSRSHRSHCSHRAKRSGPPRGGNHSGEEEPLNILPLRKYFSFKDKNSKDIIVIIKELFQFDSVDMSNLCVDDNEEFFLCEKNCFRSTIKNLKSELEQSLVLLYFCCCVGMPAMFTLGCMSYITTKGLFRFSFLLASTFISLSQRLFFKFFYG